MKSVSVAYTHIYTHTSVSVAYTYIYTHTQNQEDYLQASLHLLGIDMPVYN